VSESTPRASGGTVSPTATRRPKIRRVSVSQRLADTEAETEDTEATAARRSS
jgi:hypothetical protein